MPSLNDYLSPKASTLREDWRQLLARDWPVPGKRQKVFLPAETLLCLAASLRVNHRRYGGTTAGDAPSPVPELAALFKRPPSSVLAKMANLDGSRSHGGRFDADVADKLATDMVRVGDVYRLVLSAARHEGVNAWALPDFLGVERGGIPRAHVVY